MMLRILAALMVITAGIQAMIPPEVDHICAKPPGCKMADEPPDFPETEEELQKICEPLIDWLECNIRYRQRCMNPEREEMEMAYKVLQTFNDICSEDSLLHAAIVDNLQCYSQMIKNDKKLCPESDRSNTDRVEQFADLLKEDGSLLIENDNDTSTLHYCIDFLDVFACSALNIEKKCGIVGKDAFVEVVMRLGPSVANGCEDFYEFFPAMVDLHELEEEKSESIAEALRKRK